MKKHVATYRRLHDLTNKPSDKKGGGEHNDDTFNFMGEVRFVPEEGMSY